MKFKIFFIILFFLTASRLSFSKNLIDTDVNKNEPFWGYSCGFAYQYSRANFHISGNSTDEWDYGNGHGGLMIFEKKITDYFAIQSGFGFTASKLTGKTEDQSGTGTFYKAEAKMQYFKVPLHLYITIPGKKISTSFIAGINLNYIHSVKYNDDSMSENEDITRIVNTIQVSTSSGLEFRYHTKKFIDLFITGLYEYNISDFVEEDGNSNFHYYEFQVKTGILFRFY